MGLVYFNLAGIPKVGMSEQLPGVGSPHADLWTRRLISHFTWGLA